MTPRTAWMFNFAGWVLFTLSAIGFVWTTWRAGDMIGLAASLFFLIACLVFLVPVWATRPHHRD
ncbi:cytochrome oxidase subunit III [Roseovarius spongiae]|nr:cytochrome oxidase subunit III [Roseovarius spongiae]